MRFELTITREIALGNGTRKRGDVLATVEAVQPEDLLGAAYALVGNDLAQLPGTFELCDGVEPCEVMTALRNPHVCELAYVPAEGESVPNAPSVDDTDADRPVEPAPKRKPRTTRKK
jgi:hypothetical protein